MPSLAHKNKSGDVRFQHIPDVDQDIEHETPGHKAMDHARQGSGPEGGRQGHRLGHNDIDSPAKQLDPNPGGHAHAG